MIPAFVYFLIILFLIYKNGLFGIFKDNKISNIQFTFFFIFKCAAIPIFYWIYEVYYGGIENFDAGLFFRDSKIINSIAYENFGEYVKILFGFQDESPGSFLYREYLSRTNNWDEGTSWRLFFNDNKSMLRIHSLIHFISFNSYYVHALFSCLAGYIGIALIYRSLKHLFVSKELWLISAFVLLPNLWLFSGALLKEPIVLFNMGMIFYLTDKMFDPKTGFVKKGVYLLITLCFIYYLKPQVTLTVFILFVVYRFVLAFNLKHKGNYYLAFILLIIFMMNAVFLLVKKVSIPAFINKKQTEFYDVMKGGLFLKDELKFVRLPYDKSLIIEDTTKKEKNITIKKGVSFFYWEDVHQQDTLFCAGNTDTISKFTMIYFITPANSGFSMRPITDDLSTFYTILKGVYSGLFYPIKFNGFIHSVVSLENILLIVCFLISLYGLVVCKNKIHILFFISLVISLTVLFALTTPNTGAIVRYRSIIVPFLILSAIYSLNKKNETGTIR